MEDSSTAAQVVEILPDFVECEGSTLSSQEPAMAPSLSQMNPIHTVEFHPLLSSLTSKYFVPSSFPTSSFSPQAAKLLSRIREVTGSNVSRVTGYSD
jgi:hypothetical protein